MSGFLAQRFEKGVSGNPAGRPTGGRARALRRLDDMLNEDGIQEKLVAGLRKALEDDPVWFFKNIVMPLLPKESKGLLSAGGKVVEWQSLLETHGENPPLPGGETMSDAGPGVSRAG